MTAENLAKFRLDPNIDFWKDLKNGSDHFEVTKAEPSVTVCGKRYVFGATAKGEVSATEPCPALTRDQDVEALVAEKEQKDDAKVAELVASGVKPVRLVYADGGQNPVFAGYKDESDPDALATGPQEIVLNDRQTRAGRGQDRRRPTPPNATPRASRRRLSRPPAAQPAAPTPPVVALAAAPGQVFWRRSRRVERRGAERQEMAASGRPGARAAAGRGQRARSAGARRRAVAAASR